MTPDARTLRTIGQLSTIGLAFVFALVLGFAGGYWLDRGWVPRRGSRCSASALGLAAGILNVVRTMRAVSQPDPPPPAGAPVTAGNRASRRDPRAARDGDQRRPDRASLRAPTQR